MVKKKSGLGKGMDSLIPKTLVTADFDDQSSGPSSARTQHVLIKEVVPSSDQPRQSFSPDALSELVASIKVHGILQPLVVVEHGDKMRIIAGERRWRAATAAGLEKVPVIVRTMDDQMQLEVAIIENIQREDLTPLEAALGFSRLQQEFSSTTDDIARQVGKSVSTVINTMRLLKLPEFAQGALAAGIISEGHARTLLALKDEEQQRELLSLITKNRWSVRQAEQFVKAIKNGAETSKKAVKKTAQETTETKAIAKKLDAKVTVYNMAKGGRLIIEYKNEEDLKRITDNLL